MNGENTPTEMAYGVFAQAVSFPNGINFFAVPAHLAGDEEHGERDRHGHRRVAHRLAQRAGQQGRPAGDGAEVHSGDPQHRQEREHHQHHLPRRGHGVGGGGGPKGLKRNAKKKCGFGAGASKKYKSQKGWGDHNPHRQVGPQTKQGPNRRAMAFSRSGKFDVHLVWALLLMKFV